MAYHENGHFEIIAFEVFATFIRWSYISSFLERVRSDASMAGSGAFSDYWPSQKPIAVFALCVLCVKVPITLSL